jgi:signal transduction histidine kinase
MPHGTGFRILLVDDDAVDRMAVRRVLASTGMPLHVTEAEDGQAAVSALQEQQFDCVVTDYRLPGIDGLRLLRTMRSSGITASVLVLTGQGDEEVAVELMKAGAADYLSKHNLTSDRLGRSIRYAVAIAQAEDQRRQLLAREKAAREEAEAANRAKDEFLATLSHELRTPLNAILGWSRLIAGGNLDPAAMQRAVEIIDRNVKLQAQLIEDLLDISRIITGKLKLDLRGVRLAQVLDAAADTVRSAADAKEIRMEVDVSRAPRLVVCDAARLQQIVWNLLSNAVKFTPNGGHILVRAEEGGDSVSISVTDNGTGIQPDFLPHVFERFRQQDSATTRAHGGLGLGLAIVKHLTELHGGLVSAHSEGEGTGATFRVTLPLTSAPLEPPREEPAPAGVEMESPRLDGLRVLLVDQDSDARALATTVLESAGADVTGVATGDEAIDLMEPLRPHVLLVDVSDDDGLLLLRRVRGLPLPVSELPAGALLSIGSAEERTRALLGGFQTGVLKPVHAVELIAAVAALGSRTIRPATSTPTG